MGDETANSDAHLNLSRKSAIAFFGIKPENIWFSASESERINAKAKEQMTKIAQRNPEDEKLQLALCVLTEPTNVLPDQLRDLLERFLNSPLLHASILRYDYINRICLDRKERYLLSESPLPKTFHQSNPNHIDAFKQIAASGEQIDPDNAFFPMMQAVALFAMHHDDEALKALMRASKKRRWDDYGLDESEGVLRLWESAFGKPNGLTKSCLFGRHLEPYLIRIREMAYVATYKAIELKRKGKLAEGLEIRLAMCIVPS